jgi:hypothetical protein
LHLIIDGEERQEFKLWLTKARIVREQHFGSRRVLRGLSDESYEKVLLLHMGLSAYQSYRQRFQIIGAAVLGNAELVGAAIT